MTSISRELSDIDDVTWLSPIMLAYMCGFGLSSHIIRILLANYSERYLRNHVISQRNIVVSIMEFLTMSIVAIATLAVGWSSLLDTSYDYVDDHYHILRAVCVTPITVFYVFAFGYRHSFHWTWLLRASVCIFVLIMLLFTHDHTARAEGRANVLRFTVLWSLGFVATDQASHLTLLAHRMGYLTAISVFYVAGTLQSVVRFVFIWWLVVRFDKDLVRYNDEERLAFTRLWQIIMWPCVLVVLACNIYGWKYLRVQIHSKRSELYELELANHAGNLAYNYHGDSYEQPPPGTSVDNNFRLLDTSPKHRFGMDTVPTTNNEPTDAISGGKEHETVRLKKSSSAQGLSESPDQSSSILKKSTPGRGTIANVNGRRVSFASENEPTAGSDAKKKKKGKSSSTTTAKSRKSSKKSTNPSKQSFSGVDQKRLMQKRRGSEPLATAASVDSPASTLPGDETDSRSTSALQRIREQYDAASKYEKMLKSNEATPMNEYLNDGFYDSDEEIRPRSRSKSTGDALPVVDMYEEELEVRLIANGMEKPLGFVEVNSDDTLHGVRYRLIEELDHVPWNFKFCTKRTLSPIPPRKESTANVDDVNDHGIMFVKVDDATDGRQQEAPTPSTQIDMDAFDPSRESSTPSKKTSKKGTKKTKGKRKSVRKSSAGRPRTSSDVSDASPATSPRLPRQRSGSFASDAAGPPTLYKQRTRGRSGSNPDIVGSKSRRRSNKGPSEEEMERDRLLAEARELEQAELLRKQQRLAEQQQRMELLKERERERIRRREMEEDARRSVSGGGGFVSPRSRLPRLNLDRMQQTETQEQPPAPPPDSPSSESPKSPASPTRARSAKTPGKRRLPKVPQSKASSGSLSARGPAPRRVSSVSPRRKRTNVVRRGSTGGAPFSSRSVQLPASIRKKKVKRKAGGKAQKRSMYKR